LLFNLNVDKYTQVSDSRKLSSPFTLKMWQLYWGY